ncbi:phosphatase inhibitor-domain-containing protein [Syncephalastrum racemosum]|uniref:Type 1 phosphatases regulator n=1 Tax=Syncephalastrum racemosum TaxID=13706 RepID=A0A1X2H8V8_SYNRA|nr:phosphatase inhibitor-domain-containing protein [Syncephalastrum racemosum]
MHPATSHRMRENTSSPSHGSRTLTVDPAQEEHQSGGEQSQDDDEDVGILRLRGDMNVRRPRAIRWDDNVVDNEHMGKKKSKICCIYHKPRAVGESSSEEDSDSDSSSSSSSDSDSSSDERKHRHCQHKKKKKRNPREVSPNAYERQPVYKNRPQPPPSAAHW